MAVYKGNNGKNVLRGSTGDDKILGFGGNDVLMGRGGDDNIDGGLGNDKIYGGRGADRIDGGAGNDLIYGEGGNDKIYGGRGADLIDGGSGNDFLNGQNGDDLLKGRTGDDTLLGGSGDDTLIGGQGDDDLYGGSGNNTFYGGAGTDTVYYAGSSSDYFVVANADGSYSVSYGGSTDILWSIENIEFQDGSFAPDQLTTSLELTTGTDTLIGTAADDVITGTPATFTAFDSIDGGDGTDTFNLTDISGVGITVVPAGSSVENVEAFNYVGVSSPVTMDVSDWTGLETITLDNTGGPDAVSFTTDGNVTDVSITDASTVTLTDGAGNPDTLATVTIDGATGAVNIISDALTDLSLTDATGGVAVAAAAGTRALNVMADGVSGSLLDTTATSVDIALENTNSTVTTATFTAATAVTITGDPALTINTLTADAAAVIDASGTTGGVQITTTQLGTGQTFTGGTGDDAAIFGATTTTNAMGEGDDTVTLSTGTSALGTGGSIDGGDGDADTLVMDATDAAAASAAATFESSISGFEVLSLTSPATADVVDLANMDDISLVSIGAGAGITLDNLASDGTVTFTGTQTAASTINITGATTGLTDVLNVEISSGAGLNVNSLAVADVETVNFLTDDTALVPLGGVQHTADLTSGDDKIVTVSGDAGLAFSSSSTVLTSFDASGVTAGDVSYTTAVLTGDATLVGGAGDDLLNASNVTTATVDIEGNEGADTLVGGDLGDTLSGGDGTDTLSGGDGQDVLTGGDGIDLFAFEDGDLSGAPSATVFDTITDFNTGGSDIIQYNDGVVNAFSVVTNAISTGGVAAIDAEGFATFVATDDTLAERIVAVEAGIQTGAAAAGQFAVFEQGGNTYVFISDGGDGVDANDVLVELDGVTGLSESDFTVANQLTLA